MSRIGVVLVNYHTTREVINIANTYASYDCVDYVVVVNNETRDDEKKELKSICDSKIKVIFERDNIGYSRGNNKGIRYLLKEKNKPEYIIISNSDIEVDENVISDIVTKMEQLPQYGAVAPRMINADGSIADLRVVPLGYKRLFLQFFVSRFDQKRQNELKEDKNGIVEQTLLPGSFFICRTEALIKCRLFDPNVFLYREEEILAERMKRSGYIMGVDNNRYYRHDHNYKAESIKTIIRNHKRLFVSERYYFRRYKHADLFHMLYVCLFEYLGLIRYIARSVIKR